jgi:predicted transcriptional regulator
MPTRPISEIVEELVGDARFKEAIQLLIGHFEKGSKHKNDAILLQARYSRCQTKNNGNTVNSSELEQELNRIGDAILELSAQTASKNQVKEGDPVVTLSELEKAYRLAMTMVKVRSLLLEDYDQVKGSTIGEFTERAGLPRQFVSKELRTLEALGLLRKMRSQGRTSFTLNEKGLTFMKRVNT